MAKRFNIHDWQSKQRKKLFEEKSLSEIKGMESAAKIWDELVKTFADNKNDSLSYLNSDRTYKNFAIQSIFRAMNFNLDEHHGDDFPKDLLKKSVDKFLDDLKDKSKKDYDAVEDIIKKHFSVDEMSVTGTGASFNPGAGEGYATPKAFGNNKRKKEKIYKSLGYKKVK